MRLSYFIHRTKWVVWTMDEGNMRRISIVARFVIIKVVALIGAIVVAVSGEIGADVFKRQGFFDGMCASYEYEEGCGRF